MAGHFSPHGTRRSPVRGTKGAGAALERDFSARRGKLVADGALTGMVNMTTVIAKK